MIKDFTSIINMLQISLLYLLVSLWWTHIF